MTRYLLILAGFFLLTTGSAWARDPSRDNFSSNIYVAEWSRLRHLADLGDVDSQFQLANYYYDPPEHSSLPRSLNKAAKYYRMAAMQNHAPSQHNIGVLLLKGQGVERNWPEAYAWFELSAANGYRAAQEALATLKNVMSEADREKGDQIKRELAEKIH